MKPPRNTFNYTINNQMMRWESLPADLSQLSCLDSEQFSAAYRNRSKLIRFALSLVGEEPDTLKGIDQKPIMNQMPLIWRSSHNEAIEICHEAYLSSTSHANCSPVDLSQFKCRAHYWRA